MLALFQNITLEHVFIACACIGGALFVVRILLMMLGMGEEDPGAGGDVGDVGDVHDVSTFDADLSFKLLSLTGITGFFMMFGLVGWGILSASPAGGPWSIVAVGGGAAAGLLTIWVMSRIFVMFGKLQSIGEINLEESIGQEGSVYLTIPSKGTGKIQITVRGSLKIYDAAAEGDEEIKTGETIMVVRVLKENTLVVSKI